jgi:hypothetical protein
LHKEKTNQTTKMEELLNSLLDSWLVLTYVFGWILRRTLRGFWGFL